MGKIKTYEKNKLDQDNEAASITITDGVADDTGQAIVDLVRDRSNTTGHSTTGSDDTANTQYDIDLIDPFSVNRIILVDHNFDSYTFQYWDGAAFVDFSTAISEVGNAATTNFHSFNAVTPTLFRLIVQGTIVANADKRIAQIIITKDVGTFVAEPDLSRVIFDTDKKTTRLISGKRHISRKANSLMVRAVFPANKLQADIDLIKDLYTSFEGRLISLVGADDSGVGLTVDAFRDKDIFLMTPADDYNTAFMDGRFAHGQKNTINLVEAS